ncbi:hypothetical protein [Nostoc sp.]
MVPIEALSAALTVQLISKPKSFSPKGDRTNSSLTRLKAQERNLPP